MTDYATPYIFTALEILTAAKLNGIESNISALFPYTTAGDIAYASASNQLARLGIGSDGHVLASDGSVPLWKIPTLQTTVVTHSSSSQSVTTGNPVLWNSEVRDDKNWHSTSSNTGRITVTESGVYLPGCVLTAWMPTGGALNNYRAYLTVSGTEKYFSRGGYKENGDAVTLEFASIPLVLTAGQYIDVRPDYSGNFKTDSSFLSLVRIG